MKRGVWIVEARNVNGGRWCPVQTEFVHPTEATGRGVADWFNERTDRFMYRAVRYVPAELTRKPRKRRKR